MKALEFLLIGPGLIKHNPLVNYFMMTLMIFNDFAEAFIYRKQNRALRTGYNLYEFHKSYFPMVRRHVEDDLTASTTVLQCYKQAADMINRPVLAWTSTLSLAFVATSASLWATQLPVGHTIRNGIHILGGVILGYLGLAGSLEVLNRASGGHPACYDRQFIDVGKDNVGIAMSNTALGDRKVYDMAGHLVLDRVHRVEPPVGSFPQPC